jgi:hypothetical protein
MAIATERTFLDDPNGTRRLAAAVGDEVPASIDAPPHITKGPANYDSTPAYDTLTVAVPAVGTAGNDATTIVGESPIAGTVHAVSYIPAADITGAATNNRRLRLVNKGQDGNGSTVVAELQFVNGVNATDFDRKAITLSATAANLVVAKGDVLAWESTHIATGITDPGGRAAVEIGG